MATLETQEIDFEPDMNIIYAQREKVLKQSPQFKSSIDSAIKSLDSAAKYLEKGNIVKALDLFQRMAVIFDKGLDELEATCFYYLGVIGQTAAREDPEMAEAGIAEFNEALKRTCDPWLVLQIYNLLMIFYLSHNQFDSVMNYATATEKVASELPRSKKCMYFYYAAAYNKAEACFRQNKFSEVLGYIETALNGFAELSMHLEAAKCQGLFGSALVFTDDVKRGLPILEQSLKLFRERRDEQEVAFLLQSKGIAMYKSGNKKAAIQDLREALKLFRSFGEINAVNKTLAVLSTLE